MAASAAVAARYPAQALSHGTRSLRQGRGAELVTAPAGQAERALAALRTISRPTDEQSDLEEILR